MAAGFTTLQNQVGALIGNLNLPGSFQNSLQPNPGNTTTAVNMVIVVNGVPQGLIRSMSVDENFNFRNVAAVNSAVNVAQLPGVYTASASISRSFLFGQTMETAFGGNLRAVVGQYQATTDPTQLYFTIIEIDNLGNLLATRHNCALWSVRRAIDIDQVVIMEDAQIGILSSNTN